MVRKLRPNNRRSFKQFNCYGDNWRNFKRSNYANFTSSCGNYKKPYQTNFNSLQFKTGSSYANYTYRGGYSNRRPRSRGRGFRNAYGKPYLGRTDQNLMSYKKDMPVIDEDALTDENESNSIINSALESIIIKNECSVASHNVCGETIAISLKETAKRRLSSTDVSDWNVSKRVNNDSNKAEPIVTKRLSITGSPDSKRQKVADGNALSTTKATKLNLDGKAEKTVDNIDKMDYQKINTNLYCASLSSYKIPKKKTFSEPNETIISTISELFKQVAPEAKPTDIPEDSKRVSDERHKSHQKFHTEGPKMPSKRKNSLEGVRKSAKEKPQQIGKCRYKGAMINMKACSVILERCKAFLGRTVNVSSERSQNKVQISSSNCSGIIDKDPTEIPQVFNDKPVHSLSQSKQHELGCQKQYNNNNLPNNTIEVRKSAVDGSEKNVRNVNKISFEHYIKRKRLNSDNKASEVPESRIPISSESNGIESSSDQPEVKRIHSEGSKDISKKLADSREVFNDAMEGTRIGRLSDVPNNNPPVEYRVSNTDALSNITPVPNNSNNYRNTENNDNKSNVLQRTSYSSTYGIFPRQSMNEQFSLLDKLLHFSEYTKMQKETKVSRHFSASRVNLGISIESKPAIHPKVEQSTSIRATEEPVTRNYPEVDNLVKKEPPNIIVSCIHYAIKSEVEPFEDCCRFISDAHPELETCKSEEIPITKRSMAIMKITEVYDKTEIIHQKIPKLEKLEKLSTPDVTFIDLTESEDNNNNANDKITLYRSEEVGLDHEDEVLALSACLPGMSYLKSQEAPKMDQSNGELQEKAPKVGRYLTVSKSLFETTESISPTNAKTVCNEPIKSPLPQNYPTNAKAICNEPLLGQKNLTCTAKNDSNKAPSPVQISVRTSYPAPDVPVINTRTTSRGPAENFLQLKDISNAANQNYSISSGNKANNVDAPSLQVYRGNGAQNARFPCNNWPPVALQQWHKCIGDLVYVAICHQNSCKRLYDLFKSKNMSEFSLHVDTQSSLFRWRLYGRSLMKSIDRTRIDLSVAFLPKQHIDVIINYLNGLESAPIPLPLYYLSLHCIMSETEGFYLDHPILKNFYMIVKATACAIKEKASRANVSEFVWDKNQLDRLKQQILTYNSIKENMYRTSKESGTNNSNNNRRNEVHILNRREYNGNSYVPRDSSYSNESIQLRMFRRPNSTGKYGVNVISNGPSVNSTNSNQFSTLRKPVSPTSINQSFNNQQSLTNRMLTEPSTRTVSSANVDLPINVPFDRHSNNRSVNSPNSNQLTTLRKSVSPTSINQAPNNVQSLSNRPLTEPYTRTVSSANVDLPINVPFDRNSNNQSVNSPNSNQLTTLRKSVSPTSINQAPNNVQSLSNRPLTEPYTRTGFSDNVDLPINVPFDRNSNNQSVNSPNSNQLTTLRKSVSPTSINQAPNNAQSLSNHPLTEPYTSTSSSANVDLPINVPFDQSNVSQSSVNANLSFNDDLFVEAGTNNCPESNRDEEVIDSTACDNKNGILDELTTDEKIIVDTFACDNKNGILDGSIRDGEVIDLTWLDSIDCEELKLDVDFIKKEEPAEDEDRFDCDGSSMDGISSTYQYLYLGRLCICEKLATFICDCRMVMYCGTECQLNDWKQHKPICTKMTKQLE